MRRTHIHPPANGRTFKIIEGTGKAPFKLLFIEADGTEWRRTHHKSEDLARERARVYNPNMPVTKETK